MSPWSVTSTGHYRLSGVLQQTDQIDLQRRSVQFLDSSLQEVMLKGGSSMLTFHTSQFPRIINTTYLPSLLLFNPQHNWTSTSSESTATICMHNSNSICTWLKGVLPGHESICHSRGSIQTQVGPEGTNKGWGDTEKSDYWLQSNHALKCFFALTVPITFKMHLNQKSYLIYKNTLNTFNLLCWFDLHFIQLVPLRLGISFPREDWPRYQVTVMENYLFSLCDMLF